jgi:hypothetical protein
MFGLAGVSRKSVLTELNNIPTPTLDEFVKVMQVLTTNSNREIVFHLQSSECMYFCNRHSKTANAFLSDSTVSATSIKRD